MVKNSIVAVKLRQICTQTQKWGFDAAVWGVGLLNLLQYLSEVGVLRGP